MASFTQLSYHIVFGTKYRHPWIVESIEERLYEYIGGIIRSRNGSLIQIGGMADHIHILAHLSPSIAVSDAIRTIKAGSSKWLHELDRAHDKFAWQKGYGAFTVSFSAIDSVREYIRNQKTHHKKRSFYDEYVEFLQKHGLEFRPEWIFEDEHHG